MAKINELPASYDPYPEQLRVTWLEEPDVVLSTKWVLARGYERHGQQVPKYAIILLTPDGKIYSQENHATFSQGTEAWKSWLFKLGNNK